MGCIYIIKNTINNKVYIGKTEYTAEIRFKQHLQLASHGTTELYVNMRNLGIDNFYVETLEECSSQMLNTREKYWISKYDSFNNGYNSTTGGSTGDRINTDMISKMISEGKNKNEISKELCIRKESLCRIHNFKDTPSEIERTNKKRSVDLYSKDYEFIKTFDSVKAAYLEFNRLGLCNNIGNFYSRVKQSCEIDAIAFGHRWRDHGESYNKFKQVSNKRYCKSCGNNITGQSYCIGCYSKLMSQKCISSEQLHELMIKYNYDCNIVSTMCNVTPKTIRKWCKKYNIEIGTKDTGGTTCIELNIHFTSFKEAAEYIYNNGYTERTNITRIGYEISQAKKFGYSVFGFTWK